jgi:hypothetical protein
MRVLGFARTRRDHPHVDAYVDQAGLPAALGEADVVCVALALTRETQHLVDAAALAAMKPTACLVNVARGELLWTSRHSWPRLRSQPGLLRGRTPAAEHPLWRLPNVLITPALRPAAMASGRTMRTSWLRISAASATRRGCSALSIARPATELADQLQIRASVPLRAWYRARQLCLANTWAGYLNPLDRPTRAARLPYQSTRRDFGHRCPVPGHAPGQRPGNQPIASLRPHRARPGPSQ